MSRPKNKELTDTILRTAFQLFRAQGYKTTSYGQIADECGIAKGLVQYYFPKKDILATEMMRLITEEIGRALEQHRLTAPENSSWPEFTTLYRIGQVTYPFFFGEQGLRTFFYDVIISRKLTSSIVLFDRQWALTYLKREEHIEQPQVIDGITMIMGGFYELLYAYLEADKTPDTTQILYKVMTDVMIVLGGSDKEADALLSAGMMTNEQIEQIIADIRWPLI